jgi:CPA1 family monovalent cation:H+ antiporter
MHDLIGLELVVALILALLLSEVAARRLRLPPPVLLLLSGVVLGLVPAFRDAHLPPEVVLFIFLPMLLFWESLNTSLREIRSNFRGIVLLSTVLVVVTSAAVAVVAHALGMPWAPAWVLGAALAPTDATAVSVLARALPRRNLTVLRAESLINDGTALVIYGLAVGLAVSGDALKASHVTELFVVSYVGGIIVGGVVAAIGIAARRRLGEAVHQNLVLLALPFGAFLLAELIHASGVLAVVVCGLVMSQAGPRVGHPEGRQLTYGFWSLARHVLNAALFVLIGLELQSAVRGLDSVALTKGLVMVVVIAVVLVVVRIAWLFATVHLIRLLDRRPEQRARRMGWRWRVLSGVAGFRGAVSLAAALAVPELLDSGADFPDRDLIVFVTAGVIAMTLVQALFFPAVTRWAQLAPDTGVDEERRLAELRATEEALAALPQLADELGVAAKIQDRVRRDYEEHLAVLEASSAEQPDDSVAQRDRQYTALRQALIGRKHEAVIELRDEGVIDDIVLRQVQAKLDIEDLRLAGPHGSE